MQTDTLVPKPKDLLPHGPLDGEAGPNERDSNVLDGAPVVPETLPGSGKPAGPEPRLPVPPPVYR